MIVALLLLFGAKTVIAAVRFELLDRNTVLARLRSCPKNDVDRQAQLATYFAEVGCAGPLLTLDSARHSKIANVICSLPSSSPEKIVVGANFDHAEGARALWQLERTSLLPSLYQALAGSSRKHTFVFVGFWGEERGLLGSQQYVPKLGKEEPGEHRCHGQHGYIRCRPDRILGRTFRSHAGERGSRSGFCNEAADRGSQIGKREHRLGDISGSRSTAPLDELAIAVLFTEPTLQNVLLPRKRSVGWSKTAARVRSPAAFRQTAACRRRS